MENKQTSTNTPAETIPQKKASTPVNETWPEIDPQQQQPEKEVEFPEYKKENEREVPARNKYSDKLN